MLVNITTKESGRQMAGNVVRRCVVSSSISVERPSITAFDVASQFFHQLLVASDNTEVVGRLRIVSKRVKVLKPCRERNGLGRAQVIREQKFLADEKVRRRV